ncbi:lysyl-tRNA synthetase [Desulfamplus magnetovallimortis]|uniref:Lysyl-tRNA synthetase n=1 Tax=Desulfamplus magnetovallimortis TaxID=1246637 RepID=A0A1W1H9X0_9BACT|nr:EF-P lysine aminoacylase EpmA [Desulfamplus magnetovallimortis]SLM29280.1 lysyl-tRNA synthetase [Desulfamplus magnetovallimortis]
MKKHIEKRALMIRAIRSFFESEGYLEVETPSRIPIPVPEENIEPFESEGWYLQSSPEICMKRLAAQGYGKIFQICKCFRKDERGDRHLTELTMLEWYRKGYSYKELMAECCDLIRYVSAYIQNYGHVFPQNEKSSTKETNRHRNSNQPYLLEYGEHRIALGDKWNMISVRDAFRKYSSITMEEAEKSGRFDEIMAFEIEPELGLSTPEFIYDYPASMAALAKLKSNDHSLAERFELYIAGIELANGFSELTDPVEQRERFERVLEKRRQSEKDKHGEILPEKFLSDLGKMPLTAGIALGIDRLAMIFANASTIDEVVTFTPEIL